MGIKVEILHEDEDLILINKASGMLSIPDRYQPEKFNLKDYLDQRCGKIFVVHRLDRETSGIICFAKNARAHRNLSLQFQRGEVEKRYLVFVQGHPGKDHAIIDKPIQTASGGEHKMVVHPKGKKAVTEYWLKEKYRGFSLLEVEIHTGRTHQIRVHMEYMGFPLAVDPIYGGKEGVYLSSFKTKGYHLGRGKTERPLMSRTSLHAWSLRFQHPKNQNRLLIKAEPPKDFRALKKQLSKWAAL